MFRSISRVFFVLICASGATVAMAVNEKNDKDTTIGTTCPVRRPNGVVNTTYADNCESYASKVCYGNNGDGFANVHLNTKHVKKYNVIKHASAFSNGNWPANVKITRVHISED